MGPCPERDRSRRFPAQLPRPVAVHENRASGDPGQSGFCASCSRPWRKPLAQDADHTQRYRCGGLSLIFMDYYASNRINESDYLEVLEGVYNACEECDTKLIGGETAEMPKTFNQDIFDIAGFGIGNIIKYNEDEDNTIKPNDIVMGLLSSGFHSNGFSLIRKHMKKFDEELFYNFLEPTKLYYKPLNKIREKKIHIKGIAHITGGGFDNIKRIIPKSFDVEWELNEDFYNKSYLFQLIKTLTHSTHHEMRKTFNCGIGMMLVCPENMLKYFSNQEAIYLGKIIKKIP